jgi:flagellar hook-length control protein FliK
MAAEPALSALAMSGAPANTLQARASAQRGIAAAALPPQAEHGPHAAETAAQPAAASGPQPAPLLPLVPAFPTLTHELAQATAPHALAGRAEAIASPDLQAAGLSAMHQATGEALREAPRAAPMPPARQVMPMAMAMLLSPGATPTLSVTLDPAELGRLEIRVGREAGGASLRLIAERPETLSLLVRDQRDLQQGLAQSGITLNADGIRFEMAEQDGHARHEQQRRPGGRSRPLAETNSANPQQLVQLSLLDIRI